MIYRALKSFSAVYTVERKDGKEKRFLSMASGEEKEIEDQYLIDDLLKAGYILPVREAGEDRGPLGDDDQPHAGADPAPRVRSNRTLSGKGGKKK